MNERNSPRRRQNVKESSLGMPNARAMKRMLHGLVAGAVASSAMLAAPLVFAAEATDVFRTQIEKWVETRQITSKERTDWEAERDTLRATRDLLKDQKKALAEAIAELEEGDTVADEHRRELLLERGELQRSSRVLEERIRGMEERVLAMEARLPAPLQKKLEPLLVQIPRDPTTTRLTLGQRLMNVLGVLAQAEKFNRTATFVAETREVEGGQKVQVRTLYWGLGQAMYVDTQGHSAGVGHPGPEGWEFSNDPEVAEDTARLLDIYEGNVDVIDFVELPVAIR